MHAMSARHAKKLCHGVCVHKNRRSRSHCVANEQMILDVPEEFVLWIGSWRLRSRSGCCSRVPVRRQDVLLQTSLTLQLQFNPPAVSPAFCALFSCEQRWASGGHQPKRKEDERYEFQWIHHKTITMANCKKIMASMNGDHDEVFHMTVHVKTFNGKTSSIICGRTQEAREIKEEVERTTKIANEEQQFDNHDYIHKKYFRILFFFRNEKNENISEFFSCTSIT